MRILMTVVALGLLALGFVFGALNPAAVGIDLFGFDFSLRLGLALLLAAFAGAFLAGLTLWLLVLLPQRRRLRRVEIELKAAAESSVRAAIQ